MCKVGKIGKYLKMKGVFIMGKRFKSIVACVLLVCMCIPLAACGSKGSDGGRVSLDFQFTGDYAVQEAFYACVDQYNETQGVEDDIKVHAMPVPYNNNMSKLSTGITSDSGPDVAIATDRYFKRFASNYLDITGLISEEIIADLYPEQEIRYHYNSEKTTSNPGDPAYGLPVYNDPTVLFYNKTALETLGVICISVEKDELDAFNNGEKDHNGKTKSEYGIPVDFTVPEKGFYRENPYVSIVGESNGSSWVKPQSGELMIFNDRIACNWDEIEDVGMLCTAERNSASTTQYGYYTEWWFNYGWSVGGDCLEDLSDGNGKWVYSHADETPNYIVADGKTYTGTYTGTVYQAGETLDIKDILNAEKSDDISYTTEGGTTFYYTVNGERAAVRPEIAGKVQEGTLQELPSIREAFYRFCSLAAVGGLNVCPYPSVFNSTTSASYFSTGKLAFLVETYSNVATFNEKCKFDWGIARMPQYKVYTDPEDPTCDEVSASGRIASHSEGYCVVIRKGTAKQKEALKFVEWLTTEGQKIFAEHGFGSVCRSDAAAAGEKMTEKFGIENTTAILDSLQQAKAGDWWYLMDNAWIDTWSIPLNTEVRYGTMTFDEYIYRFIEETNKKLLNY